MTPDTWAVLVCLVLAGLLIFGAVIDAVVKARR